MRVRVANAICGKICNLDSGRRVDAGAALEFGFGFHAVDAFVRKGGDFATS